MAYKIERDRVSCSLSCLAMLLSLALWAALLAGAVAIVRWVWFL